MSGAEGAPSGVLPSSHAEDEKSGTPAKLVELQHECAERYFAAIEAMNHRTKREILLAVTDNSGSATYEETAEYVSSSNRTMRKHISNLEADELVQRVNSRSHALTFPNSNVRVLVAHALDCHFKRGF